MVARQRARHSMVTVDVRREAWITSHGTRYVGICRWPCVHARTVLPRTITLAEADCRETIQASQHCYEQREPHAAINCPMWRCESRKTNGGSATAGE
jgi:hypothetical protein